MGGQHLGTGVKLGQQPAHTVPLGCRQLVGTLGAEEIGTTYGARQYRPAGADISGLARIAAEQVRQVVGRMARRRQGRDLEGSYRDLATIAERQALVGKAQVLPLGQHIDRPQLAGQSQAPAHIVVVDVGLQHVGNGDAEGLGRRYVALRFTLRVDHYCDIAVMDQVAAVP